MARIETPLPGAVRPRIVTVSTMAHGDTIVVQLRGDLDRSSVPALAAALASAAALKTPNVVVDLSEVHFINAATVRVITAARDFMSGEGRTFELRSPSRGAQRILDLCGVRCPVKPEGT